MNELKLTSLDSNQIPRYSYDEENQAIRVSIVNDSTGFQDYVKKNYPLEYQAISERALKNPQYITVPTVEKIEIPVIIKEIELKTVEIPVITVQKEILVVEKQVIVKETDIQIIEKPVFITEYKIVETQVIVREKEIVYVEKLNMKMFFIMQTITLALIVLSKFIK